MLREFLRRVPLFVDLGEDELARVEAAVREEGWPENRVVFREGDPVDAFYLVRAGSVTVFRDAPGKPSQVLARLEPGGYFGEMGLLNQAHRLASARTAGPTTLLRIDKADLLGLLAANPGLELKLRAEVIRRHGRNVSALLGLAGQRDVRIRLGVEAVADLPDGTRLPVVLENLSLGGVALSGAPREWQPGTALRFTLGRRDEPAVLPVEGSVSWREGETVGIAFHPATRGHGAAVYRALRSFLGHG